MEPFGDMLTIEQPLPQISFDLIKLSDPDIAD
jgi:hypothetical protein